MISGLLLALMVVSINGTDYCVKFSDIKSIDMNNLVLELEVSEPKPSIDLMKKYPRDFFRDYDRTPTFMVVKTRKFM